MNRQKGIPYHPDIYNKFIAALEHDRARYVHDWLATWEYQEKREKRGVRYEKNLIQNFNQFNGPGELLQWFNWHLMQPKPDYFNEEQVRELVALCRVFDENISKAYNLELDFQNYDQYIGRNNAQDYILANLYPHPADNSVHKILDFGAGYGRQSNLWTQRHPDLIYVGMDAIPNSYCLQHLYYAHSERLVYDYVLNPQQQLPDFTTSGIYHIPTWRADLLPDNAFDKIIVVQVLPELNGRLVKNMIAMFHRILKPSGALYIRDHDRAWQPGHRLNVNTVLQNSGFTLEYRAHIVNDIDLHGIPRIWRKTNKAVIDTQKYSFAQRMYQAKVNLDALTHGKIKRILKSFLGSSKSSH